MTSMVKLLQLVLLLHHLIVGLHMYSQKEQHRVNHFYCSITIETNNTSKNNTSSSRALTNVCKMNS